MRLLLGWLLLSAVGGFFGSANASSHAPASEKHLAGKRGCARLSPENEQFSARVQVDWRVTYRSPTCFFFSGPGALGSYTPLGNSATYTKNAETATLEFGNATFRGTQRDLAVSLMRQQTYEHGGPWVATETLEGAWRTPSESARPGVCGAPPTLEATYTYHECEGTDAARCGTDGCTITATLVARPSSP